MPFKKFTGDEHGFTYTLEAIIGVFLIIGTLVFVTGGMPYTAQKTGEHSKVQLMNIGRDTLDMIEVTRISDVFPDYWEGIVYRNYTLVADKKFVAPGENVTFTVYRLGLTEIFYQNLTLTRSTLGLSNEVGIGTINGTNTTNFSSTGEFNIRAVDELDNKGNPKNNWSNYVTINVGHYYLDTDVGGISENSSKIVEGVVYNSSGLGIPDLEIEILEYDFDCYPNSSCPPYAITTSGRIIEGFENATDWDSDPGANKGSNTTNFTQGLKSLSVNGTSSFWIQRTNSTGYNLDYYDILSFDFYSPTSDERKIKIVLSNNSNNLNEFIWENISVNNKGWNKINFKLTNLTDIENLCCHPNYPELEGAITAMPDINTIKIIVSNITANEDYLFDNLIAGAGKFSFIWPISGGGSTGTYYIQANDSYGNISNKHRIVYSNDALIYANKYIIYEGDSVTITLIPGGSTKKFTDINKFNINQDKYNNYDPNKISISEPFAQDLKVILTANTSGDYYIFYGNVGQGPSDPAAAAFTNTILIRVLPIDRNDLLIEDVSCAGFNGTQLSDYMRRFVPQYVNYNLYLISPTGNSVSTSNPDDPLFLNCRKFNPVINGYPTDEAVTVNKILHIDKQRNLGYMGELRMVLWYK